MAITRLTIQEFLQLAKQHPLLDVRSPGEFNHAHIPGAHSLPLFSDEERKVVGTAYKQESQRKAIKLGLDFFGVKMVKMVEAVEGICKEHNAGSDNDRPAVLVHCWRGGMRSAGVAWLLDLYGFKVFTLVGGYKVYRKWVLGQFEKEYPIKLLGGYTGSGKSALLQQMVTERSCMIDLETLASHKGSAFGNLGMPPQPSQEMFENLLAEQLSNTVLNPQLEAIWMEDESQRIGEVNIPIALFRHMRTKELFFLNIPFEERLDYIMQHYGKFEREKLMNAIMRIQKRLGGLETKTAINHLLEDNVRGCFGVLLHYYDKYYLKSIQHNRENFANLLHNVNADTVDAVVNVKKIKSAGSQNAKVKMQKSKN